MSLWLATAKTRLLSDNPRNIFRSLICITKISILEAGRGHLRFRRRHVKHHVDHAERSTAAAEPRMTIGQCTDSQEPRLLSFWSHIQLESLKYLPLDSSKPGVRFEPRRSFAFGGVLHIGTTVFIVPSFAFCGRSMVLSSLPLVRRLWTQHSPP